MGLALGIVGLPNVGKSTLFNALTRAGALAANYPFATIEPNTGVVPVPDERLPVLAGISGSAKTVPAAVTFTDIAGLVRGASEGQGLGNQFLAHIRESDAICQVVRVFADDDVVHVDGRVSPADDIETVNTELVLADLQTLDKRMKRLETDAKKDRATWGPVLDVAREAREHLDAGRTLFSAGLGGRPELRELSLLTGKPFVYVFNVDEDQLADSELRERLVASVAPAQAVVLAARLEEELVGLPDEEAAEMLGAYGLERSGLAELVGLGYRTLGLQTYLTTGPKETRAWTIHAGDTAPKAAGVIHTDFERGFIRAQVVSFEDLVRVGSFVEARAKGVAAHRGQGLRHGRGRRRGVPLQRVEGCTSAGQRPTDPLQSAHGPQEVQGRGREGPLLLAGCGPRRTWARRRR